MWPDRFILAQRRNLASIRLSARRYFECQTNGAPRVENRIFRPGPLLRRSVSAFEILIVLRMKQRRYSIKLCATPRSTDHEKDDFASLVRGKLCRSEHDGSKCGCLRARSLSCGLRRTARRGCCDTACCGASCGRCAGGGCCQTAGCSSQSLLSHPALTAFLLICAFGDGEHWMPTSGHSSG